MTPRPATPVVRFKRAILFAGAVGALTLPSSGAQAGFFDFLFPQPPQYAVPVYRDAPPHAVKRKRAAAPKKKVYADKPHTPARTVASVMEDDSLETGDAVMTREGLRIFVGPPGLPRSAHDFVKVSEAKRLSSRTREALLAVEPNRALAAVVTGRSAASDGVSAGETIVDARGVRIRYVGP